MQAFGYDTTTGVRWKVNDYYFADEPTAQWVASRWGTGELHESDVLGPGPFAVSAKMYEFKTNDGRWVNAGMVAGYYDRNPPSRFPGVAESLIAGVLGLAPFPLLPPVLKPSPPPVKPMPKNTFVGPRNQFGTYSAAGDPNPAGTVIDNPHLPGKEKLIKVVEDFFGMSYWMDAPADAVIGAPKKK